MINPGTVDEGYNSDSRRSAVSGDGKERMIHAFGWAGEAWATNYDGTIIVGQFHPRDQFNHPLTQQGASTYKYTA